MDAYDLGSSLSDRATSAFPLSIGTSLAFESVFSPTQAPYDPSRTIPDHVDVKSYQTCWINMMTLFRNLSSAVTKEVFLSAKPKALADVLESEIEVIQGLFSHEGQNLCKPEFYWSTYKTLKAQRTPGLEFREPSTDAQKFYTARMAETLDEMEKRTDSYYIFDDAIHPERKDHAFALTHFPYDLTQFSRFDRLDLLESNTGVLKPRSRWNTKYNPMSGQSFDHLPFLREILLILGDKVLVKPMAASLRKQLLETSLSRNWTPMTTIAKVKMDLELDIRDPYTLAILRSL